MLQPKELLVFYRASTLSEVDNGSYANAARLFRVSGSDFFLGFCSEAPKSPRTYAAMRRGSDAATLSFAFSAGRFIRGPSTNRGTHPLSLSSTSKPVRPL